LIIEQIFEFLYQFFVIFASNNVVINVKHEQTVCEIF